MPPGRPRVLREPLRLRLRESDLEPETAEPASHVHMISCPPQAARDGTGAKRSEAGGADGPDAIDRTLATRPKIKTSPTRNTFIGARLSERGTLADLD
jgi:hypothetical protein